MCVFFCLKNSGIFHMCTLSLENGFLYVFSSDICYCGIRANDALVDLLIITSSNVVFQVSCIVILSIGIVATVATAIRVNEAFGEISLFSCGRARFPGLCLLLCTFFHQNLVGTMNSDGMHKCSSNSASYWHGLQ